MRYSCNLPEVHPRVHHDPRSRAQTGAAVPYDAQRADLGHGRLSALAHTHRILYKESSEAVDSAPNSRTGLRPAEMEIEKSRAETGAPNPPRMDRTTRNCPLETGTRPPNPRKC